MNRTKLFFSIPRINLSEFSRFQLNLKFLAISFIIVASYFTTYAQKGQQKFNIYNGNFSKGIYLVKLYFDCTLLADGLYFIKLFNFAQSTTIKVLK